MQDKLTQVVVWNGGIREGGRNMTTTPMRVVRRKRVWRGGGVAAQYGGHPMSLGFVGTGMPAQVSSSAAHRNRVQAGFTEKL
jgi:hypothetical protein